LSNGLRRSLVDVHDPDLSIREQCRLLGIHRSLFYYQPIGESPLNLELMKLIDQVHLLEPCFGYRRICEILRRMGHQINEKRVLRLMQKMSISAQYPKPKTSIKNSEHQIYPYLLKGLTIDEPNQVWCADITYIPIEGGYFYLVAIMDWYSRYVLAWELSNSMETSFCLEALSWALRKSKPEIFNTDQGSQFTSKRFVDALKEKQIKVSHDGKGRFMDNIFIERLWRSLKYEEVYLYCYEDGREAYQGISSWIRRHNELNPHSSFGYKTPEEVYSNMRKKKINISNFQKFF